MTQDASRQAKLVLVADDDPDILGLLAFRLGRAGHDVIEAGDGAQALALAQERIPDLAVLDVMMPRLDGYEVTRRLRESDSTKEIPVILLTARVQQADITRGFAVGANDYIRKPFSPQELGARVQAVLGRR